MDERKASADRLTEDSTLFQHAATFGPDPISLTIQSLIARRSYIPFLLPRVLDKICLRHRWLTYYSSKQINVMTLYLTGLLIDCTAVLAVGGYYLYCIIMKRETEDPRVYIRIVLSALGTSRDTTAY